ncbi:MAG: tRNA (adenosine(37)-N6)-threonylcarbamoyltransferase complex ATPase subunit type 1 TsaE [Eubacteriales bacterium]|nr:tRNA (adenosine(37)-N6)-threonylcarbamoyltransferase complex ATPase subunit type 1 TsaE [Eubacteriales bacterium]
MKETEYPLNIETFKADETFKAGFDMGRSAKAGQIFCLEGDLGVGKTVFTQGFAKGLDITEPISSPTFTIVQEYTEGRIPLYHFDVYRIGDVSEMDEIGYEEYFFSDGVCLVEWGNLIKELLPDNTVYITISKNLEKGFDYRSITVDTSKSEMEGQYEAIGN